MMLHQFAFAVQGIVRGQSSIASNQVKDLQAISPDGMAQLMRWNRQSAAEEDGACVQDLIQRTCQQQPHAMAVCAWDGSWSYQELDCQASHLASQLCDHGIEPEKFVGLLFEKSKWTTVAILAVLKAGGAFVLLDPTQPAAYLSAICTMTRTALLLCSSRNQRLAAELRQTTIQVPRDPYHGAMPTSDFRRQSSPAVQPHHPLYACFTSGSTGRPKGSSSTMWHSTAVCRRTLTQLAWDAIPGSSSLRRIALHPVSRINSPHSLWGLRYACRPRKSCKTMLKVPFPSCRRPG